MLTEHEQKLVNEQIKAYQNMIKYFKQQVAKLQTKLHPERCCFEDNRKRLPIAK